MECPKLSIRITENIYDLESVIFFPQESSPKNSIQIKRSNFIFPYPNNHFLKPNQIKKKK